MEGGRDEIRDRADKSRIKKKAEMEERTCRAFAFVLDTYFINLTGSQIFSCDYLN